MELFSNGSGLTAHEFEFYGRQLVLSGIGVDGQKKLNNSRVTVVGAGGLGSPACLYLASSGIGCLRIIDGDQVALTNLQRQIIHDLKSLHENKAESAAERCRKLNAMIDVEPVAEFLSEKNALVLLKDSHVVVDATDNARARYLVNDACSFLQIPLVFGSALRWQGQLSVFFPFHKGPCFRCIFPCPPEVNETTSCELQGVLGIVPGVIGTLQAAEAVKLCLGKIDQCLIQRMLIFDSLDPCRMWRNVKLRDRNPDCLCSKSLASLPLFQLRKECPDAVFPMLNAEECISSQEFFNEMLQLQVQHNQQLDKMVKCLRVIPEKADKCLVLDVRPILHFQALHIGGSLNAPLADLAQCFSTLEKDEQKKRIETLLSNSIKSVQEIYCLCRKGRDAAKATVLLREKLPNITSGCTPRIRCVSGGILGLKHDVQQLQHFPFL